MTDDSNLVQKRDAADYSALCMHILSLDDILTAAVESDRSVNDADRDALVGIGTTLEREFNQVVYSIDRIETLARQAERSMARANRSLPAPLTIRLFPNEVLVASVDRAAEVIRTIGPGEVAKLGDTVAWLANNSGRHNADLPRQVRGALMIIIACLLMILAHASTNAIDGGGLYTIAGSLFSTGLPMLNGPDE